MKKIKLNNGVEMPQLGYGVYQVEPDTAHSLFLDHHSGERTKQFMEWRAVVKPTE